MSRQRCGYCGSRKHTFKHCPRTASGQAARARLRCGYCGGRNHSIKACPRLHSGAYWPADEYVRD